MSAVRAIIADVLEVTADELTEDSAPGKVAGWDSLTTLEILAAVEAELGVTLALEELTEVVTVADWEARVRAHAG